VHNAGKDSAGPVRDDAEACGIIGTFMHQASPQSTKVQVIDRATEVLLVLSRHPDGMTLTELTKETGLHKATAQRFLRSLEQNGLAEKQHSGKYWGLGPVIFEMAARAERRQDVREIARPIMREICDATGLTVQLAVLGGGEVVYVEKVEPPDLVIRINSQVGARRPVHCTALGKVLCAELDWDTVAQILASRGMPPFTSHTITTPDALKRELGKVRNQGFACDNHEYNDLVICVAAPVRNAAAVVAGLSISRPGVSSEHKVTDQMIATAVDGASRISRKLGWNADDHK